MKMKDPQDTVKGDIIPKRPGRPAKHGAPMTPAERQRAYRNRVRSLSIVAEREPSLASRPELLKALNSRLQELDEDFDQRGVRLIAEDLLRALVTRYDLKL